MQLHPVESLSVVDLFWWSISVVDLYPIFQQSPLILQARPFFIFHVFYLAESFFSCWYSPPLISIVRSLFVFAIGLGLSWEQRFFVKSNLDHGSVQDTRYLISLWFSLSLSMKWSIPSVIWNFYLGTTRLKFVYQSRLIHMHVWEFQSILLVNETKI